ncbi:MAG: hypothetical protein WAT09_07745 [Paracoccaceae bacterium]
MRLWTAVLALTLCACVDPGAQSYQTVQGQPLKVGLEDVFWPATKSELAAQAKATKAGQDYGVEPFPFMTALVVSRRDGGRLGPADEAMAYSAVSAHCAGNGWPPPPRDATLTQTGWAFLPCAP